MFSHLIREPVFPPSILPHKDSTHHEVTLTEAESSKCVTAAMSDYLQCETSDSLVTCVSNLSTNRRPGRPPKKSLQPLGGTNDGFGNFTYLQDCVVVHLFLSNICIKNCHFSRFLS